MAKNVYLVVSDLHASCNNKINRINYQDEIEFVERELLRLAGSYRKQGCNVHFLLLGDVFDRSYQDVFKAVAANNFFIALEREFGDIYSVIGNHELSYYSSNPFFTLVSEVSSEKLKSVTNKVWTPVGVIPVIRIVDRLEDGEVVFHFNHYGTAISEPELGKINIGLFHQELLLPGVKASMEQQIGREIYGKELEQSFSKFNGYQYAFLGHMHSIYGVWKVDNCYVSYLASLGRTSVAEVNNNFLERSIPAVCVENGKFSCIQNYTLTLPNREQTVNEQTVEAAKKSYKRVKANRAIRSYVPLEDDPMKNLKALFVEEPLITRLLNELQERETDVYGDQLKQEVMKLEEI